jgi:hypothetical protein
VPPLRPLLPPLLPTDATLAGTPASLALLPQSLLPTSVLLRRLLLPPGVTGSLRADSAADMAQLPRLLLLLRGVLLPLPAAGPDALLLLLPGGGVTTSGPRPRGSHV